MKKPIFTILVVIAGLYLAAVHRTAAQPASPRSEEPAQHESTLPASSDDAPSETNAPVHSWGPTAVQPFAERAGISGTLPDAPDILVECTEAAVALAPGADEGPGDPRLISRRCAFDEDGRLLVMQSDVLGFDGTTIERRSIFLFDESGNMVQENLDEGGDGTIDHCMRFTFDDQGARIGSEWDFGADGQIEQTCRYQPPCPRPFDSCSLSCERVE